MNKVIALSYPEGVEAPFIVAKGKNLVAERILQIAEENNIAVVKDDILADTLSLYDIGSYIPAETYSAIANIFAFLYKVNDEKNLH